MITQAGGLPPIQAAQRLALRALTKKEEERKITLMS